MSLVQLASDLKRKLSANAIRVVGIPETPIRRVSLIPGWVWSEPDIRELDRDDVDVLVGGEGLEWEIVEHARDSIALGRAKGPVLLGHSVSEEAGTRYCSIWLKRFVEEVPVEFISAGEPFWTP